MAEVKNSIPASDTEIPVSDIGTSHNSNLSKNSLSLQGKLPLILGAFVILIIATFAFLVLSSGKQSSNVDPLYTGAQDAVNKGDYEQAQKLLRQALSINQGDPKALSTMITTISLEGNQTGSEAAALQQSQPYIDQTLKAGNNDVNTLISIGYAYETGGDYQKAFNYYDQATKADPKSSAAWFHRGHVLMFLNRISEGYDNYTQAVKLDPNNALAQLGIAGRLYSEKKTEESFQAYKRVSEMQNISLQTKAEALATASDIRRSQDNYLHMDEALTLSKLAVDADPTFAPALAAYGYNLFLTGDPTQGETYMKNAIAANPRISRNYSDLGILLRGVKNFTDSINYQKQAISLVDNDNTIMSASDRSIWKGTYAYELAKTYEMAGINVDKMPLLQQAVQLNPNIKAVIKSDMNQFGFFKDLSSNASFQALIN